MAMNAEYLVKGFCNEDKALVTIIIVNWNGRLLLADCIDGIQKQTFRQFDTIVVDNGSEDDSVAFVSSTYPEVKLISLKRNLGFAKANNIAIQNSRSKYVALINNDAHVEPDWLGNLVYALENSPEAGLAASKMVYADNPAIIDRAGDGYSVAGAGILRGRGEDATHYNKPAWIFGACAGAALYRKDMLAEIGLFDEDFFLLYEDVDLSFRAQLNGYRCLYVPDAVVYHMATKSIGYDSAKSVYYGHRNLEWTYIQNMPKKLIFRTIGPHFLYIIFALIFFFLIGHGKTYLKAKKDALKGLKKSINKRKQVQTCRKVSSNYIRQLLDPENFFPRYARRLRNKK